MKIIQEIYPAQIKLIQSDNEREFKKQLDNYNIKHIKADCIILNAKNQ